MFRVIVESPFAGDTPEEIEENLTYARAAMADCLRRGEAPYASHLLYTQPGVLDDTIAEERDLGIEAGLVWGRAATATVVYLDRGFSSGMARGVLSAVKNGRVIAPRRLTPLPCARASNGDLARWAGWWVQVREIEGEHALIRKLDPWENDQLVTVPLGQLVVF